MFQFQQLVAEAVHRGLHFHAADGHLDQILERGGLFLVERPEHLFQSLHGLQPLLLLAQTVLIALDRGGQLLQRFGVVVEFFPVELLTLAIDGQLPAGKLLLIPRVGLPLKLRLEPGKLGFESHDLVAEPVGFGLVDLGVEGDEELTRFHRVPDPHVDLPDHGAFQGFHDDGGAVGHQLAPALDDHVGPGGAGPDDGEADRRKGEPDSELDEKGQGLIPDLQRVGLGSDDLPGRLLPGFGTVEKSHFMPPHSFADSRIPGRCPADRPIPRGIRRRRSGRRR